MVSTVNDALVNVRKELDVIQSSQQRIAADIDALKAEIHGTRTEVVYPTEGFEQLSNTNNTLDSRLKELTRRLNHSEQLLYDRDIIITNVQRKTEKEDPIELVTQFAEQLGLSVDAPKIEHCGRIKLVNSNNVSPIIVRFKDWKLKNEFMKRARNRRLCDQQMDGEKRRRRVFVHHRYTTTFQRLDKIIRERFTGVFSSWYKRGSFFLKHKNEHTPIEVLSIDDLPSSTRTE